MSYPEISISTLQCQFLDIVALVCLKFLPLAQWPSQYQFDQP
uniref:Uncharacterized protein n=1 Tax=Rhizophora mucronata TaxID=61149 RepID=A0A2P2QX32_RHIMU